MAERQTCFHLSLLEQLIWSTIHLKREGYVLVGVLALGGNKWTATWELCNWETKCSFVPDASSLSRWYWLQAVAILGAVEGNMPQYDHLGSVVFFSSKGMVKVWDFSCSPMLWGKCTHTLFCFSSIRPLWSCIINLWVGMEGMLSHSAVAWWMFCMQRGSWQSYGVRSKGETPTLTQPPPVPQTLDLMSMFISGSLSPGN